MKPVLAKTAAVLAGFCLWGGFVSQGSSQQGDLERLYASAVERLQKGELDSALQEFLVLVERGPKVPEPYLYLGRIYVAKNLPAKAEEVLRKAIQLKPDFVDAHHVLGNAFLQQSLYPKAEQSLLQAVRLAPNDARVRLDLGHAYLNQNKNEQAAREFEKVIELRQANQKILFAAYFNLALVHDRRGEQETALGYFEKSHHLFPENLDSLLFLCELYFKLERQSEARAVLQKLVVAASQQPSLYPRLAKILTESSRYAELAELLEQARKTLPPTFELLHDLGVAYSTLGRHSDAATALEQALEIKQDSADAYLTLGKVYSRLNDRRSIEALRKSVELDPKREEAWEALAREVADDIERMGTKRSDSVEQARRTFETYAKLFPQSTIPHLLLGEVLFNVGDITMAVAEFQRAVQLDPKSSRALYTLGAAYKFTGRNKEAKPLLQQAVSAAPENIQAIVELGELLNLEGNYDGAIALLKKALKLKPSSFDAHFKLGQIYLAQRKYEDARSALMEAIRLNSGHTQTHYFLAKVYFGLNEKKLAEAEYERFRALEKQDAEQAKGTGRGYLDGGPRARR